jgi:hypothetical protein
VIAGAEAQKWLQAWEGAAADLAAAFVRDPRTLAFGATMLRAHLAWRRAGEALADAIWAPFVGDDL